MTEKLIYRMSGAGHCPRALSAEKLGYKPEAFPSWLELAAKEGNKHEQWIKEELQADDIAVYAEQEEIQISLDGAVLIGHIDCKTNDHGTERVTEIKSMSQFEFDRWEKEGFGGFRDYAAQITCYMKATGLPALYIVKNRSSGYIEKRILLEPPMTMKEVCDNIATISEHVLAKKLVKREYSASDIRCRRCGFQYLCLKTKEQMTKATEDELLVAASKYREGKALMSRGQELYESARDKFKEHSIASDLGKWRFDDLIVNLIHKKETVTYPKGNLLKVFTEEQLKLAGVVGIIEVPYDYVRIVDAKKEEQ